MKRITTSLLIPFVALAACDGETGFNGPGDGGAPAAGFTIDVNNGFDVTATTYKAALSSGEFADLADPGLVNGGAGGLNKPVLQVVSGGIIDQVISNIPIGPDEQLCVVSGTVTFSGDIVDPLALANGFLSIGDTFRVEYMACDDGIGEVIDGMVDMVVTAFAGDILSGAYELTMDIVVTDLQVTTVDNVILSNGDATASINSLLTPFISASVGGNSMTVQDNTTAETLSDYLSSQTLDAGLIPSPYTMLASGTLDSSQLAGVVTYSTPVIFEGFDTNYPSTGEFLVNSGSSTARLVAVDDVNVRIEIDSDRDGTVDETIETTWAELLAT